MYTTKLQGLFLESLEQHHEEKFKNDMLMTVENCVNWLLQTLYWVKGFFFTFFYKLNIYIHYSKYAKSVNRRIY